MIKLRRAAERGYADRGWLRSYHSFSFADYYDPDYVQFGVLRVLNEDFVGPGQGFGMHPHRDMEIITYVLSGALEHRDSMGTGSVIRAGDVQRMSAGTGVRHSEFNASDTDELHLLQIWLLPAKLGIEPSYEERRLEAGAKDGRWALVASPDGGENSMTINQDARVLLASVAPGQALGYELPAGRSAYLHVATGSASLNDQLLQAGDAAMLWEEPRLEVGNANAAEVLLFDMPL